jgi:hypothetical protein
MSEEQRRMMFGQTGASVLQAADQKNETLKRRPAAIRGPLLSSIGQWPDRNQCSGSKQSVLYPLRCIVGNGLGSRTLAS